MYIAYIYPHKKANSQAIPPLPFSYSTPLILPSWLPYFSYSTPLSWLPKENVDPNVIQHLTSLWLDKITACEFQIIEGGKVFLKPCLGLQKLKFTLYLMSP